MVPGDEHKPVGANHQSRESSLGIVTTSVQPERVPGAATRAEALVADDALTTLVALVGDDLAATNQAIVDRMDSPVALIPQLAAHIVAAGGKRLRPLLTLAAARMCGYEGARHVQLAACVEFIHTATLLHDDVVDESLLRRGMSSANSVFGNKASVLVGDFLFARAFQLMVLDGSLKVLGILSHAAATIAEGEVLQLVIQNDLSTPMDRYLDVIRGKTAALFTAACQVGAVVAERPGAEEQALADYGSNLGMAFQLVDDALDYAGRPGAAGQDRGRRFPGGQGDAPGARRLPGRGRGGAGVLAPHDRAERADRGGPRPGAGADAGRRAPSAPPSSTPPGSRRRPRRRWHRSRPGRIGTRCWRWRITR